MLSVSQLITPLTKEQVKAKLYELAAALGLPTTAWVSGAPTRVLIAILAEIFGAFMAPLVVLLAKSGFLDDAEGSWLTLLAALVYGVDRREATHASGTLTVTNAGGGVYPFEIREAVFRNTTTLATYINTEAFTLNGPGAVDVAIECEQLGRAGNAGIGEVDGLVLVLPSVTVSNAAEVVGVDAELDEELRDRARAKLAAVSPNGAKDAYRYVALSPEFNGGANITRAYTIGATGNSTVTVVLAGPDGAPTAPDVALAEEAFDDTVEPDTVTATALAAVELPLDYEIDLIVDSAAGLTDAEWQALVQTTLVAWVRTLPINGIRLASPPALGVVPWRAVVGVVERIQLTEGGVYYVKEAQLADETDTTVPFANVAVLSTVDVTVNVSQVAS